MGPNNQVKTEKRIIEMNPKFCSQMLTAPDENNQHQITLKELLVGMVIVIDDQQFHWNYIRNMRQGDFDRYTQQVES